MGEALVAVKHDGILASRVLRLDRVKSNSRREKQRTREMSFTTSQPWTLIRSNFLCAKSDESLRYKKTRSETIQFRTRQRRVVPRFLAPHGTPRLYSVIYLDM